jgi:hypothetical protein
MSQALKTNLFGFDGAGSGIDSEVDALTRKVLLAHTLEKMQSLYRCPTP